MTRPIRYLIVFLTVVLSSVPMMRGDDIRTVSAEYTFYGDSNHSPADCKRLALEGARLAAMAQEFGTTLSQTVYAHDVVNSNGEDNFFSSLSETEVKGEWLEDIGEPSYNQSFDSEGNVVVTCRIKGKARKISNNAPEFTATVLRNGSSLKYASTDFVSGDDMRLYFKAPVDGYAVVYLLGEDRMAYTLLPYSGSSNGYMPIKHGVEYVFFDTSKSDPTHGQVDEIMLQTDLPVEHDRFYILFSPKPFMKANDSFTGESLPRSLPFKEFSAWLSKIRRNDPSLGVKTIDVTIKGL